ncbi:hypothetical protein HanPSC8_Chr15g0652821 [Helianthus annuus]|nr:hypothetical protein HanPSC8_Chr15g0652821 [Helianthus annuus]
MVLCWCGKEVALRTSWTVRNPGRRFISCPNLGNHSWTHTWKKCT